MAIKPVTITFINRGPIHWLMNRYGIGGIALPWHQILILGECSHRQDILRHELVHIEQIERDGPVKFTIKYLYWLIRYGYWNNPLEIEAYAKAPIAAE